MRERHGESKTRLYRTWQDMKRRCSNPKRHEYQYYGGRGISVCDEWKDSYTSFRDWALSNGYNDTLSIERLDVNGNYCPENCTWVCFSEQAKNKRNNFLITYLGQTNIIADWSRETGLHENTLTHRIRDLGWNLSDSLMTVPKGRLKRYDVDGEKLTISEMSRRYGLPLKLLWKRINTYGWDAHQAVNTPIHKRDGASNGCS